MIGILGGMGTQAGLDFCNKLAMLNRGKIDQEYPLFMLYNKSDIPGRPESIGIQTKEFSDLPRNAKNITKYNKVLKSLLDGCRSLEKSGCKFIVIPCNTAHYWYEDLKKKIKIPIINMPKEVFLNTKKVCKIIPNVKPRLSLMPFFQPLCMLVVITNKMSGPGSKVRASEVKRNRKSVFNSS